MIIGGTRILCETADCQNPQTFGSLIKSIVVLLDDSVADAHEDLEGLNEEADSREFDSAYSKLAYAGVTDIDPTEDIPANGVSCGTIKVAAELRRQNRFRCLAWPVRPVSPAREFDGNKVEQLAAEGRGFLDVATESADLSGSVRVICQHRLPVRILALGGRTKSHPHRATRRNGASNAADPA